MFGQNSNTGGVAPVSVPMQTAPVAGAGSVTKHEQAARTAPWFLAVLVGLYILWAGVEQHQKAQESIKPSNIAVNVRNLAWFAVTLVLVANLLKIAAAKLAAWNIPGAKMLVRLVGAV